MSRQIKLSLVVSLLFACIIAGTGTKRVNAAADSFVITSDGVLTAYTGNESQVVIPDTVTVIGSKAFYNQGQITSIVVPKTVRTIESSAFEGCTAVRSITMQEGILSIEDRAFARCINITKITVPETVAEIGKEAFYNCKKLQEAVLPEKVSVLKSGLFQGCESLANFTIPKAAYAVEDSVFEGCRALKSVIFHANLSSFGKKAFKNCEKLASVTLPSFAEAIGEEAFFNCKSLTKITIPETVCRIERYAFYGCSALKEVAVPNAVSAIGEEAFANCSALKSVALPNKLTVIAAKLFNNCKSLQEVQLPAGTVAVKESAFRNCSSLKELAITKDVTSFDPRAVEGCKSLQRILVADGNSVYSEQDGSLYSKDGSVLVKAVVREGAFSVPEKVTAIGPLAFYNETRLVSISLGSVTKIDDYAFFGCSSIQRITIPSTLTKVGGGVFQGLDGLYRIEVQEGSSYVVEDGILYGKNRAEGGMSLLLVPRTKGGMITIPETVGEEQVTAVESAAFQGCASVTKIQLPESIVRMESAAFAGCVNLTAVNIPENVKVLSNDLFSGCSRLSAITIPEAVTEIKPGAFADCTALSGIRIPKDVKAVYPGTFEGCIRLSDIVVDSENDSLVVEDGLLYRVTDSAKVLVRGSVSITGAVVIPEDVTDIGYHSLADCKGLVSVTVAGDGLVTVKDPFAGLESLKTFAVFADVKQEFSPVLSKETDLFASRDAALVMQYAASVPNDFYVIEQGEKVVANCAVPAGLTAVHMQTLLDVSLPDGYRFEAPLSQSVGAIGTSKVTLLYTPEDTTYLKEAVVQASLVVKPRTFAIAYVLNGGTNGSRNPSEYTETVEVSLEEPKRAGYAFDGWYTDKSLTKPFAGIKKDTAGDITLYAKWKVSTFKISYVLNGGAVSGNPASYQSMAPSITLKNPTRKGYSFSGWYIGSRKVSQIAKGTTGNLTVTAKWKALSYSIKYNAAGGSLAKGSQTSYTVETKAITLKNPTRKGYVFAGWYQGSKKVTTIKKGSTGNVSLTAKWTKVTVAKGKIARVKNDKAKTVTVNVKKQSGADGYVYEFSTDKKFKSQVKTATSRSNTCSLNKFLKGKTYYVRVYAYRYDSAGNKVAGAKSTVSKIKVTK